MVFRAPKSVGVTTGISASNPKPASSAKRQNSASKPGPSTASRLGFLSSNLSEIDNFQARLPSTSPKLEGS